MSTTAHKLCAVTWENAKWADAHMLDGWVHASVAPERFGACGVAYAVSTWRDRGRVSFWAVDRVFTRLGLHVAQLPDRVWVG